MHSFPIFRHLQMPVVGKPLSHGSIEIPIADFGTCHENDLEAREDEVILALSVHA